MEDKQHSLFSDFNPISKQEWIKQVNLDLKGEDFSKKLVWKNLNNIELQPFYTREDTINQLINTGENVQNLINFRNIRVKSATTANKYALKAIEEGINGLLFTISSIVSISELLDAVNLNEIAVAFALENDEIEVAADFFKFAESQKVNPKKLRGYFDLNYISNYIINGKLDETFTEKTVSLLKLAVNYPNFKIITLSGKEYLDSGSNQVQEVAFTLNSLVFVIEKLQEKGVSNQTVFDNLHIQLAIGSEYFIEIGKFRAFNSLLHQIALKYNVTELNQLLTAKTSIWNKSVTDAHTNLLRATTEVMSALLGNVTGVLVDAYDSEFNELSDFSARIAGNITTILKEESYFGKVANPVDGSYYIEKVTSKIANNALAIFKKIEKAGGFFIAFENEIIQQQIATIKLEKIKLINQRKLVLVGANKYPNLMETVKSSMFYEAEETNTKTLKPRRASLEIEVIRKTTENLTIQLNHRPQIALVSYGNLTMRKARAAFSYDFLGVSGFSILPEESFENAQIAAEESAKTNTEIVVICSSDDDYNETALLFVRTFRAINIKAVLLLAGNPVNISDELRKAGLDGFIHLKSEITTTIAAIQQKIQHQKKSN